VKFPGDQSRDADSPEAPGLPEVRTIRIERSSAENVTQLAQRFFSAR